MTKYFEIDEENLSVLWNDNERNIYTSIVIIKIQKEQIESKNIWVWLQHENFLLKYKSPSHTITVRNISKRLFYYIYLA